jgi:hypothetical protein
MFLFNGAPIGTEDKIAKASLQPRKPQGYESLFAKYQREKEIMEQRNNKSPKNSHIPLNYGAHDSNYKFDGDNDYNYSKNISFKIYDDEDDNMEEYRKHSRKEKKYGNDIYEEQQEQSNDNNNYDGLENCNEIPNDAEESEEESALISPPAKKKVVKSLFDELDFLDDFENYSEFNNHLLLSKDVVKKKIKSSEGNSDENTAKNVTSSANSVHTKKDLSSSRQQPEKVGQKLAKNISQRRPNSVEKNIFIESNQFAGARKGYIFKMDKKGLGYYKDVYYRRPLSEPKRCRQNQAQLQPQQQLSSRQTKQSSFRKKSKSSKNVNSNINGPQPIRKKKIPNANVYTKKKNTDPLLHGIDSMLHSKGPSIDVGANDMLSTSLPPAMMQGVKLPKVASLPKLKEQLSLMRKESSGISLKKNTQQSYSKRLPQREMDLNPDKPFDYAKLREAMEYAKKFEFQVNSEKLMEGAGTANSGNKGSKRSGSSNNNNDKSTNNLRRKKGTNREHKILRDVYKNRSRIVAGGGRNGSGNNRRRGSKQKKGNLHKNKKNQPKSNIESLVENFEHGIELKRLRAELEESKQSYYNSNKFIEQSQTWFNA